MPNQDLTKDDYLQWRSNIVTEVVFKRIQERVEGLKELLANSAGHDSNEDRKLVGLILAYRTLLNMGWEDMQDDS